MQSSYWIGSSWKGSSKNSKNESGKLKVARFESGKLKVARLKRGKMSSMFRTKLPLKGRIHYEYNSKNWKRIWLLWAWMWDSELKTLNFIS
jgi:hypothetical protein